jgi:hypothetical protein
MPEDENLRDRETRESEDKHEAERKPAIQHKYGEGKEQPPQPVHDSESD